ncbi:MAG: hypothetical protein M5U08_12950 [Burkholderiales bacterium]|nr:hypothetical protein [Burkholderiales bacterium]
MTYGLKRITCAALASALVLSSCAAPYSPGYQAAERGMQAVGTGLTNLFLAPVMIVAGLLQGLAFLPYTAGLALDDLNRALMQAHAVSLEDSYRAAYGVSLSDERVDPKTGQVADGGFGFGRFRRGALADASDAFQRLLVSQGMPDSVARHYVIVADYTHTRSRRVILLAVVYRHTGAEPFQVASKHTGIVTMFRPDDLGWRSAYERDVRGHLVDEVIDWTAIDYAALQEDKLVATLMVLGAESIKSGRRSHEYWAAEKRWIAGETTQLMAESRSKVQQALAMK